MIKINRMDLADLGSVNALINGLLKQLPDLTIPVPIEEIAIALDIKEILPLEAEGFEGGLITYSDKSEGTILVNKKNSHQRQRFTIGHELGHFLSPWHEPTADNGFLCKSSDFVVSDQKTKNKAHRIEAEANKFSASLLMPEKYLRKDIRALGDPDLKHIWQLADKYDVSKEALARRYVEIHDECCAIVISKNGIYQYSYRHEDFPFIYLTKGQALSNKSLSKTDLSQEGIFSYWSKVLPELWISQGATLTTLNEQTILQRNEYRMTLLHGVLKEDDDEDEELEERLTPRFR
jgi:Zn-dependent peptidase ImmA (M78 family)